MSSVYIGHSHMVHLPHLILNTFDFEQVLFGVSFAVVVCVLSWRKQFNSM